MRKQVIMVWLCLFLLSGAAVLAESFSGTITLSAGQGFNFSTGQVLVEKDNEVSGADIVFHDFIQTRERGLRLTRDKPLSALYNLKDQMYVYEVSLFKTIGTIDDCISNSYYLKPGIAPILGRSYCVVLDKKNEVLALDQRTVVRFKVAKLGKDSVKLDWVYYHYNIEEEKEKVPVETVPSKEVPAETQPQNSTPSSVNEAPAHPAPEKKLFKKHNWKPWAILWAVVFVLVLGYELWRGFGRGK